MNEVETKYCNGCEKHLPVDLFSFRNKRKGTRQGRCKSCVVLVRRKHYTENREKIVKDNYATKMKRYAFFMEWKRNIGCERCGESEPICLDLHHVSDDKEYDIAKKVKDLCWDTLVKELDKCIVVCRNCHAKIHAGLI